jgi:hypothetical protein
MNGFTLNGFTRVGQKIHGKCSACGRAVKMDAEGWLNDCPEDCPLAVFLLREDDQDVAAEEAQRRERERASELLLLQPKPSATVRPQRRRSSN